MGRRQRLYLPTHAYILTGRDCLQVEGRIHAERYLVRRMLLSERREEGKGTVDGEMMMKMMMVVGG